jgi:murein DD-endopeptidase MepM/ murein hydrolase activator NlpD
MMTAEDDHAVTSTDPEGLIGADEHPPIDAGEGTRRMIVSSVWGGTPMRVLTEHGMEATWLGGQYPEPCGLYAYARGYCMTGCKHPGMDISMPAGTELRAIEGGNVFQIRNPGVSGSIEVRVRAANGHQHLYNHMSRSVVAKGTNVTEGQLLGYSGVANSPHLHFELRVPNAACRNGVAIVDPEGLLTSGGTSGGGGSTSFDAGDRIRVVNPPLRFRTGPGLSAEIIEELPLGAELTVMAGPQDVDGYAWYQARKVDDDTEGWLAGQFCARVTS